MAAGALAEVVTEEVASNLEEVAQATRALDTRALGFFTGGMFVGGAIGFYFGYRFNKEKLRLEAFKESEAEVEAIRETYRRKEIAVEGKIDKAAVAELIEERGYSTHVDVSQHYVRPLPAPVPVSEPDVSYPVIETPTAIVQQGRDKNTGWNYKTELAGRTPNAPYVIHQDEHQQSEHGYEQVEYVYWDGDGVLTDSDNQPLLDGRSIVGAENLKWGHGSDDVNMVHVRNDTLELEMSITRDPRSWEEQDGLDAEDALRHSSQSRPAPRRSRRDT